MQFRTSWLRPVLKMCVSLIKTSTVPIVVDDVSITAMMLAKYVKTVACSRDLAVLRAS